MSLELLAAGLTAAQLSAMKSTLAVLPAPPWRVDLVSGMGAPGRWSVVADGPVLGSSGIAQGQVEVAVTQEGLDSPAGAVAHFIADARAFLPKLLEAVAFLEDSRALALKRHRDELSGHEGRHTRLAEHAARLEAKLASKRCGCGSETNLRVLSTGGVICAPCGESYVAEVAKSRAAPKKKAGRKK